MSPFDKNEKRKHYESTYSHRFHERFFKFHGSGPGCGGRNTPGKTGGCHYCKASGRRRGGDPAGADGRPGRPHGNRSGTRPFGRFGAGLLRDPAGWEDGCYGNGPGLGSQPGSGRKERSTEGHQLRNRPDDPGSHPTGMPGFYHRYWRQRYHRWRSRYAVSSGI